MKVGVIMSAIFYLVSIFFYPAQATSTVQFQGTIMQASCTFDAADVDVGDIDFSSAITLLVKMP
ncbi:hypothetical protein OJE16_18845 [Pantoea tagorei]